MTDKEANRLTYEDIAKKLEVKTASVRTYRKRGDLPQPDGHFGRTPYWDSETIDKYIIEKRINRRTQKESGEQYDAQ